MDGVSGVSREMPRYQSHKTVHALKIAAAEVHEDGSVTIVPADDGFAPIKLDSEWGSRFKGDSDDPGYLVQYADGYRSWSPTEAFEDGYMPVD